ncbi:MAG: hypothetical protein ACRDJP_08785 [Actinomycetota bacterium]
MRRLFWVGVGAAGAIYATRWIRRQRRRLSPQAVGASVGDVLSDLGRLVRVSADEARRAAAEKEAELRATVGAPSSAVRSGPPA